MEQTIMKLTGPISELAPTMVGMDKTMTDVLAQCDKMKAKIGSTYDEVSGARKDIAGMRRDVHALKEPVLSLYKPIKEVSEPLNAIKQQLNVIAWVVLASGLVVAFGIPISCILFWKFRSKLIPQMLNEPAATVAEKPEDSVSETPVDLPEKPAE